MTKGLLIISFIIVIILMVLPIIITMVISKQAKVKERELFKKIVSSILIVDVIVLVILLSLWITPIKNNDLKISDKTTTTSKEESSDDELSAAGFTEVSLEEYLELLKSSEKQIILIARPTCYYCQQFTPILKQAKEEMNLKINYVNTDNLTQDDWSTFQNSLDYLKNEEWGTPLVLIVKDGKLLDQNNGYVELNDIKEFFKNNGLGE